MARTLGERARASVAEEFPPTAFLIIESAESIRTLVASDQGLHPEKLSVTRASLAHWLIGH
jgi:hypothetical protein